MIIEPENIEIIAEIGLILLLFIIGLELDLNSLITSGKRLAVVGVGQFVICVLLGLAVFSVSGFNSGEGSLDVLYVALLCALSSTAIVIKSLNDKFELDTLHGKLSVGILIIQDLWAIVILALQPNFNNFQVSIIGLGLGHIHELTFAILIYTMVFTSIISSYLIKYNYQIYHRFDHLLERFRLPGRSAAQSETVEHLSYPIVILGYVALNPWSKPSRNSSQSCLIRSW